MIWIRANSTYRVISRVLPEWYQNRTKLYSELWGHDPPSRNLSSR